jgi:antitoxin StbD
MDPILAPSSVGISELKANPSAVLEASDDMPVAILNRNKPVGYLISAKAWEAICNQLEDIELRRIAEERLKDGKKMIKVAVDDL